MAKPQHRSRPGGSILCFPLQLIFYISFRLSSLSQARRRDAPAGRLHFRAGLRWEHRVTPLMKGRDGLSSLQGGHLSPDQRQQDGVRMLIKNKKNKKKKRRKVVPKVHSDANSPRGKPLLLKQDMHCLCHITFLAKGRY